MADDNTEAMMDKFMDLAASGENPLEDKAVEADKPNPGAKFLQKALNALNEVVAKTSGKKTVKLKEDGNMGPKTRLVTQNAIQGLPPEMRRWAVGRMKKGIDDTRNIQTELAAGANEGVQEAAQITTEEEIKSQY